MNGQQLNRQQIKEQKNEQLMDGEQIKEQDKRRRDEWTVRELNMDAWTTNEWTTGGNLPR